MHGGMCTSLALEWLEEPYSHATFTNISFIGQCPVNMNIAVSKIVVLQVGPKTQNDNFLEF
jgi:argininosuccinate synthase